MNVSHSTNRDAGWGAFTDIGLGRIVCTADSETARLVSNVYTGHYNGYYDFAINGHETDGLLYRYERYPTQVDGEYDYRIVLRHYEGSDIEVTIPSGCGVYGIENGVFLNRLNLQKVVIPSGVTFIGESAFNGCAVLHEGAEQNVIELPNTLKRVGNLGFRGLGDAYTSQRFYLVLPASLQEFDLNIFTDCRAVLVAPEGSHAAAVLYAGWYRFYYTLEDAMAQRNPQYKYDPNDPQHEHYGNL